MEGESTLMLSPGLSTVESGRKVKRMDRAISNCKKKSITMEPSIRVSRKASESRFL